MGSSLSAIYDDVQEYARLCAKYGEEPVRDEVGINPYSDHAKELKNRARRGEQGTGDDTSVHVSPASLDFTDK